MNPESINKKEKTRGREAPLTAIDKKSSELREKRQRNWITEEEYEKGMEKIEGERLDALTRPE